MPRTILDTEELDAIRALARKYAQARVAAGYQAAEMPAASTSPWSARSAGRA